MSLCSGACLSKPYFVDCLDLDDLKILYNDWPYGVDTKIVHLCVWTKFVLEDDPKTGELMPEMRWQIDKYVDKTFKSRVPVGDVSQTPFLVIMFPPPLIHKGVIDLAEGHMV